MTNIEIGDIVVHKIRTTPRSPRHIPPHAWPKGYVIGKDKTYIEVEWFDEESQSVSLLPKWLPLNGYGEKWEKYEPKQTE